MVEIVIAFGIVESVIALSIVVIALNMVVGVILLCINKKINRLRAGYKSTVDDERRRKALGVKPDKKLIRIWRRRLREQKVGSTDYEIYKKMLEACGEKCGD